MLIQTIKVFSGTSNPALTESICSYLGISVGGARVEPFPDGEKFIQLEDDVRGKDCFVIQSTCNPVDENLMELLIFLDCLKRASAARITAVIPYFGYARQDRKDAGRVPITAKLVANLITTAGADRVVSIDMHAAQLQGFFDIPVDHLMAQSVLSRYFKKKKVEDLTVVAADVGNIKMASKYASVLGGELAIIHKRRISGSEVKYDPDTDPLITGDEFPVPGNGNVRTSPSGLTFTVSGRVVTIDLSMVDQAGGKTINVDLSTQVSLRN